MLDLRQGNSNSMAPMKSVAKAGLEDVPRHVGSPNEEGFGQDWSSDVPGSASQPLVEDGAPRGFGNVEQVLAIATERRRASRPSGGTANRPGRMLRRFSRIMELIRRRSN